jgi:hypothetical protein
MPKFGKIAVAVVCACLVGISGFLLVSKATSASPLACPRGTVETECVLGFVLPASYDALPKDLQQQLSVVLPKSLFGPDDGYNFQIDEDGQMRFRKSRRSVESIREEIFHFDRPAGGAKFGAQIVTLRRSTMKSTVADQLKQTKGRKASCEPEKPFVVALFPEEPLRRCLRTMFLLENVGEFNARTQALFRSQKMTYSDGTVGPFSLDKPGLTDEDRANVVRAVKIIDTKARALGGFR